MKKIYILLILMLALVCGEASAKTSIIWSGSKDMGSSWRTDVQLPSYSLIELAADDVIEIRFTVNAGTSPQIQLWANGYGKKLVDSDPLTGNSYKFTVTESLFPDLRKGLTIKGAGYTLTEVVIISESQEGGDDDMEIADGTFRVDGTDILDANGHRFIMRGVNYSYAWQHGHETTVIPAAKRIGANCIRIQLGTGAVYSKVTAPELEYLIKLCERNKLIAIFNTHDETGDDDIQSLENAVNYWIEMKDVLNAHLSTVIVNISNEWYGTWDADGWAEGYRMAIPKLRDAGVRNMLVVDCAGYGQYPESLFRHGRDVASRDKDANTVFSIHFYDSAGATDALVESNIDKALALGVPLLIGEFAYEHKGNHVSWQKILDYCTAKDVGYLGWSWTGNGGGTEACDMFAGYDDSQMKENGHCIIEGRNGIRETSKECSVFSGDLGDDTAVEGISSDKSESFDYEAPYEIFNIMGSRVFDMIPGNIYILRQGHKAVKVIR